MNNVKNYKTIRIHRAAYDWLQRVALKYAQLGSPRSMTALASQAIMTIQEPEHPNGNGTKPVDQLAISLPAGNTADRQD